MISEARITINNVDIREEMEKLKVQLEEKTRWAAALNSCVDIQAEYIHKIGHYHSYKNYCVKRTMKDEK